MTANTDLQKQKLKGTHMNRSSKQSMGFILGVAMGLMVLTSACGEGQSEKSEVSDSGASSGGCPHVMRVSASKIDIEFPGGLQLAGGKYKSCSFDLKPGQGAEILSSVVIGTASVSGTDSILVRRDYRALGTSNTAAAHSQLTTSGPFTITEQGSFSVPSQGVVAAFRFDLGRARASNITVERISINLR